MTGLPGNPIVLFMKLLVTQIPLAMHTKLKWYARHQGDSMAKIVRALINGWLAGDFDITEHLKEDQARVGRPITTHEDGPDFYDQLYEKVSEAVDG